MNKILLFEKKIWPTSRGNDTSFDTFLFEYVDLEYIVKEALFKDDIVKYIGIPRYSKIDTDFIQNVINDNLHTNVVAVNLNSFFTDDDPNQNVDFDNLIKFVNQTPNIFFIFFYHELNLYLYNTIYIPKNVLFILNSFSLSHNVIDNVVSYYHINWNLQKNNRNFYHVNKRFFNFKRHKKYSFYNGIHKPIRFFAYDILIDNDMLNDGYFSYLDYANHIDNPENINEIMKLFRLEKIGDYHKLRKKFKIPYLLDSSFIHPNWSDVPPFMNPLSHTLNSYINITAETNYFTSYEYVSISEKSYKPFISFNIPLIIGQPSIYPYMRDCGFDMFDDFFDNSECKTTNDMLNQIKQNFTKINKMSIDDIHNFYIKNLHRLEHNFEIVTSSAYNKMISLIHSNMR
jgi:hypothetical protein